MTDQNCEEKKKLWERYIREQKQSGLSVTEWCLKNDLKDYVFYYWRRKLSPIEGLKRSDFVNLKCNHSFDSQNFEMAGIKIDCQGVQIHLDKDFDVLSLKQCIMALREVSC